MAIFLPPGFKVLTEELDDSATVLKNLGAHMELELKHLAGQLHGFVATTAMEDGEYGSSRPGQAFEDYWQKMHPRITTLFADIGDVGKALETASAHYHNAEQASTAKVHHHHKPPTCGPHHHKPAKPAPHHQKPSAQTPKRRAA